MSDAEKAAEKWTKGFPAFMRADMKRAFVAGWLAACRRAEATAPPPSSHAIEE